MMTKVLSNNDRVLAIAPSSRGFGFAVLEGRNLVDWGATTVAGDKNARCVARVEAIVTLYRPTVLVIEDAATTVPRRSERVRKLVPEIVSVSSLKGLSPVLLPRARVRAVFFGDQPGTKHGLVEILAKWFPDELGCRMPPKRRPWTSEDYRMSIFEAVALALAFRLRKDGRREK